jgi:hypothetical protein
MEALIEFLCLLNLILRRFILLFTPSSHVKFSYVK